MYWLFQSNPNNMIINCRLLLFTPYAGPLPAHGPVFQDEMLYRHPPARGCLPSSLYIEIKLRPAEVRPL